MRILVIDDETPAIQLMKRRLEAVCPGAEIQCSQSAVEGLALVSADAEEGRAPDVAFLDIEMPGVTGLELALRLKEIKNDINIVFVTAYSEYALDAIKQYASGYLLKPVTDADIASSLEHLRNPLPKENKRRLKVQCFGHFEVFADGVPVRFNRTKAKELLAYLVDRRGAAANASEIYGILWEMRENSRGLRSQAQNVISSLRQTLESVGAADVLVKSWNSIAVNPDSFDCDYYDMLKGDVDALNMYTGEYMANYSWAEATGSVLYLRTIK